MQHKKRRTQYIIRYKRIFVFVFLVCFIVSAISIYLSLRARNVVYKAKTYYFVSVNCQTLKEGDETSKKLKPLGAGGLIYIDETVYVDISVYQNYAEAKKIAEDLTEKGIHAQVVEYSHGNLKIKTNKTMAKTLSDALNYISRTHDKLYDLAVKLSKNTESEAYAYAVINQITANFLEHAKKVENYKIKEYLLTVADTLKSCVLDVSVPLVSLIRYADCFIIREQKTFL